MKEINIKNRTYYFFDFTVNIKTIDPNNIKMKYAKIQQYSYLQHWLCKTK